MQQKDTANHQIFTAKIYLHILTLFSLALGVRVYLWQKYPHVIFLHEADGMTYIGIARNIIENFSISNATHFPPFYPALIAIFSLFVGNYETGARVASIFMGSCIVIPFYLACRYLMSNRAAFCAALFIGFFGTLVDYGLQPISQATYAGLIALGVWLGLRNTDFPSRTSIACFGVVSAAIYLTRPEGILFYAVNLPVILCVVLLTANDRKEKMKRCVVLVISFVVPFLWYVFNLKRYTGYWSISGKSGVTSIGIDASMKLLPGGKTYGETLAGSAGLATMFTNVEAFTTTYLAQSKKFAVLVYSTLPHIMLFFVLVGIFVIFFWAFREARTGRILAICKIWIFLSPLALIVPVMLFDKISVSAGYILPFFMVCFGCCATGLVWLEFTVTSLLGKLFRIPDTVRNHIPIAVITSIYISWLIFMPFYKFISSEEFGFMSSQQDFLLRQTGHWLRNRSDANSKIMGRWSNIGYYGDRSWVGLVDGSVEEVTEYARRHGATYIVIDSDSVPRRRPKLAPLLNPTSDYPGLIPVYADQQFETRVIIYRVK